MRIERWVSQNAFSNSKSAIFFLFFFTAGVSDTLEPCRSRVGTCRRNEKKKEDTRRTPKFGKSYPFQCPTLVQHRHDAKNGVSMQPSLVLLVLEGLGFGWCATTEAPWRISAVEEDVAV